MNDNARAASLPGSDAHGVPKVVVTTWRRLRPWLIGLVALGLATALLYELRGLLAQVRYADILSEIEATPAVKLVWAIGATALSFLALSGYDASGLRYIGVTVKRSALLLISGVTPATDDAADLLSLHVPLTLVEAAHLIGSIAGVAMLFVARGLLARLDAAWWAALVLSVLADILAIPKGIAVSEAAMLGLLATLLVISRKQFDRTSALFAMTFERGWWLSIALVLAVCTWLLFFVYQDVAYTDQLWWQFEFDANAPRSLRALMAVALTVLVIALDRVARSNRSGVSGRARTRVRRVGV